MVKTINHWIGGKEVAGKGSRKSPVFNPATGEQTGELTLATTAEMDAAVQNAQQAFPGWANTTPLRRSRILNKFLGILDARAKDLAACITSEHGKVLSDALGEVQRGAEVVEFATAAPTLLKGDYTENVGTKVDSWSIRQPLGVVAGITPFNFPGHGSHVDVPHRTCRRQLLHSQAIRTRSFSLAVDRSLAQGSRTSRWCVQRRAW